VEQNIGYVFQIWAVQEALRVGRDMINEAYYEKYIHNPAFLEFVNREFDLAAAGSPLEDLADFAFGGLEEAIQAFERHLKSRIITQPEEGPTPDETV
jgi:hypothetical protein